MKAGATCRYVDNGADANGDDTVTDLNTGLMWEKQTGTVGGTSSGRIDDVNNTYTWSTGDNLADGTAFTVFLATLNNGDSEEGEFTTPITGCFANHCDWRLPSIVELQGIIDFSATGCLSRNPCIDPIFGPAQPSFYWSATTAGGISFEAWFLYYAGVTYFSDVKTNGQYTYVQCVAASDRLLGSWQPWANRRRCP